LLAQSDVKIDSTNNISQTPLLYAVRQRHILIINIFLARDDGRIYFKDNNGRTLLSHALKYG
jgi:ankyrin repeat protein